MSSTAFLRNCLLVLLTTVPLLVAGENQNPGVPVFERDVQPLLTAKCASCHGTSPQAGLDVRTPAALLKGSNNGPVVIPKSAPKSVLYQKIASQAMPPGKEGKLSAEEVSLVGRWIDGGAPVPALEPASAIAAPAAAEAPVITEKDRQFWAFQKPLPPPAPKVRQARRVRNPIDAFILDKLEQKSLGLSPDADRRTLIRRAYFDLTGLPPSPAQVDAFAADPSPEAYERLLDTLLASKHFGEQWGRHWLDAAGYVDNQGLDHLVDDYKMLDGKYRYRDYVVNAFNKDKPYDRFLKEQIAGDELVKWRDAPSLNPEIVECLTATGFLRTASDDTDHDELNTMPERYGVVNQTIQTLTSAVLGLTVACAKCHNHKYDPIPQQDYYRLMAVLASAYNPEKWVQPKDRFLVDVPAAERERIDKHNEGIDRELAPLKKNLAALKRPYEDRLRQPKLAQIPESLRQDLVAAIYAAPDKRTPLEKYLIDKLGSLVKVDPDDVTKAISEDDKKRVDAVEENIRLMEARKLSYGKLQALYDVGEPPAMHLLRRGNLETPGAEVQPAAISVLSDPGRPFAIPAMDPSWKTSGRRLAFAEWLTDASAPSGGLVARVMVNRIWQHLFGEGIVATPENFGHSGSPPKNRELLDWMAVQFMNSGWRIKPMIRLVMLSSVYRQASYRDTPLPGPDPAKVDPGNQLLWRMPLRRLESENVRDAILMISGKLNESVGGPPIPLEYQNDGMVKVAEKDENKAPVDPFRRSLYLFSRRNYNLTMLSVFDQPVMNGNCTRRVSSSVVLQSLTMMNDGFILQQSEELAQRLASSAGPSAGARVQQAFHTILMRRPTPEEIESSTSLLERQTRRFETGKAKDPSLKALANLCRMLLNANEFIYI
jgi:hypothetical protein